MDHVYQVPHFVRPGETLASADYQLCYGGKGFNQSIALARAGCSVLHAGAIGADGECLLNLLQEEKVDIQRIARVDIPTGHAIIQVDETGQNAIVLYSGANFSITTASFPGIFDGLGDQDHFLCQNETSAAKEALTAARKKGLTVWFNPAPMGKEVLDYPLEDVNWLVVNETEGAMLSGNKDPEKIPGILAERYPEMNVVLTLGGEGVAAIIQDHCYRLPAVKTEVVDTTAAGDTFIGYLIAGIAEGLSNEKSLQRAIRAAAISVSRKGAAQSIPRIGSDL